MTDNDIIKALECCTNPKVGEKCPRAKFVDVCNDGCIRILMEQALNLINRQKAEVERLKHRKTELQIRNQELQHEKSEAIKEFWDKLKAQNTMDKRIISVKSGNNLVKEMTEVETNPRKEDEEK